MDTKEIGKFIAVCRKEKGLTQAELAEKLGITDRAVSKWETGKNLPDQSLMTELCALLGITVNDLLSGERLEESDYKEKAEMHLAEIANKDRELLFVESVMCYTCTVAAMVMIFAGAYAAGSPWTYILIVGAMVMLVITGAVGIKIEHDAGYYECPNCGKKYVPSMKAVIMAPHNFRDRYLKCPYCGKKGMHKKVIK